MRSDIERLEIIVFVFICVIYFLCFGLSIRSIQQKRLAGEAIINEGYAIYLNGQKVDLSNININAYQIIIDDDSKKIILSNKIR